MNESTIGNQGAKGIPLDPSLIVGPHVAVPNPILFETTISKSDKEAAPNGISASVPHISSTAYFSVKASIAQICLDFLSRWNDAIRKEEETIKQEDKQIEVQKDLDRIANLQKAHKVDDAALSDKLTLKGATNQSAFLTSLPVDATIHNLNLDGRYIAMEIVGAVMTDIAANRRPKVEGTEGSSASKPEKSFEIGPEHFITAAMVLGAGALAMTQTISGPSSGGMHVEVKVIQDAFNAVFPAAAQAQLAVLVAGWFSSMWGGALVLKMTAEGLQKYVRGEAGTHKHDLNFAKTYAEILAGSLNSPEFNKLMLVALNKANELSPSASQQDPNVLLAKGKMIMLALTLALVYKLEVASGLEIDGKFDEGHVSSMDVSGLLKNKIDLKSYDKETASIIRMLVDEFDKHSELIKNEIEKEDIKERIFAYLDTQPSVEGLTDQQLIFNNLLGPKELYDPSGING